MIPEVIQLLREILAELKTLNAKLYFFNPGAGGIGTIYPVNYVGHCCVCSNCAGSGGSGRTTGMSLCPRHSAGSFGTGGSGSDSVGKAS